MNYIYDIVLNFQDHYYNFFEWNRKDKIKNIAKIPVYRVSDQDILNLKYNQIKIDSSFLNKIKEDNKKYKKIMCLVSNTQISLGLLFEMDGTLSKRSSLLFDEEEEVNNYSQTLPITPIPYIENQKVSPHNCLRLEIEKKDTLIEYINDTKDILTLKYLYYEYFNKECNDVIKIKNSLKKELDQPWTQKQNNLYHLIKLLNSKIKNNSF